MPAIGKKTMSNIEAIILAGGLGTRLRSQVHERQKVAALVRGRPFIHYLLEKLHAEGIDKVTLALGHKADSVQENLAEFNSKLQLNYSLENNPLGTAGALRLALEKTNADNLLILNGDSYLDESLQDFIAWWKAAGFEAAMLIAQVPDVSRFGQVRINKRGKVLAFTEKGQDQGKGWINAGVYLLKRKLIMNLTKGQNYSLEKELFPDLLQKGLLYAKTSQAAFIDIGTAESYKQAQDFFDNFPLP
ncbi:MAG: nucleotidyltransferase family protein [Lentisphaeria bacterium]|nr:nucleotidyltransferase family protein [Lentisphaeria bacterium]